MKAVFEKAVFESSGYDQFRTPGNMKRMFNGGSACESLQLPGKANVVGSLTYGAIVIVQITIHTFGTDFMAR